MTTERKRALFDQWLPVIVAMLGAVMLNAVIVGIAYGRIVQTAEAEEKARSEKDVALSTEIMPMDKRVEYFVTRKEWELRNATRDAEIHADKEAWVRAVDRLETKQNAFDGKIDALLARK